MLPIVQSCFLLLILAVDAIDIVQVRIDADSANSWIVRNDNEGFIIDCGCYWEHGVQLARTWQQYFASDTLPSFVILTHPHPDNILGLVSLLDELNVTRLPVYVSDAGAINEMNYWLDIWRRIDPFQTSPLLDRRQSPDQFAYNDHVQVIDRPLNLSTIDNVHIVSNFPIAESVHASLVFIPAIDALFTGDLVSVRSHLLVSPSDAFSDSDHHVCNWIGILQSLSCTFPSSTKIYPAHGDGPSPMAFVDTVDANIRWLIYMRALIFNSCNTTFVMRFLEDVFQNYSNVDQSRASFANRIPQSAMSLGCKCFRNAPSTCGGLQPPSCPFLPKNRTESSKSSAVPLGCLRQHLSSARRRSDHTLLLILVSAIMSFVLRSGFSFSRSSCK